MIRVLGEGLERSPGGTADGPFDAGACMEELDDLPARFQQPRMISLVLGDGHDHVQDFVELMFRDADGREVVCEFCEVLIALD